MHNGSSIKIYSNSRLSEYDNCMRKGYFRYQKNLAYSGRSWPLAFGQAIHQAMDVIWQGAKTSLDNDQLASSAFEAWEKCWINEYELPLLDEMSEDDLRGSGARNDLTAFEIIVNYVEKRRPFIKSVELLSVERPFAVPLDPSNPNLFYVGKMDKEINWNGAIWGVDHKTTSAYQREGYFRHSFLDSFSPNSQIDGYLHALHMEYGDQAKGMLVDAILVHKTEHEGFALLPVERQFSQLDAWLWEALERVKRVEQEEFALIGAKEQIKGAPFMPAFPKNTGNCIMYGKCPYIDLCKMISNPETLEHIPEGYVEITTRPFDELRLIESGILEKK